MTICIGTLCEKRKIAIFACDRMLTSPLLSVEFEHDEPKWQKLSKTSIALSAGEAMPHTEVCRKVVSVIQKKASPAIADIANTICNEYRACKMSRIEEKYFKPRGFSIEEYLRLQKHLNENVVLRLERAIESGEIRMSFILIGVDKLGAHIFDIHDPGHAECFDRLGFHAIGSGLPHAISAFISFDYTPNIDLKTATFMTYEAKKHAERAPGVGKTATDMGIVSNKGIRVIKAKEIEKLEAIHEKKVELETKNITNIEGMISNLPF